MVDLPNFTKFLKAFKIQIWGIKSHIWGKMFDVKYQFYIKKTGHQRQVYFAEYCKMQKNVEECVDLLGH